MATSIRELVRRLAGCSTPVPPDTGQRIEAREQAAARDRLLAQARRRNVCEYRYDRPAR